MEQVAILKATTTQERERKKLERETNKERSTLEEKKEKTIEKAKWAKIAKPKKKHNEKMLGQWDRSCILPLRQNYHHKGTYLYILASSSLTV